MYKLIKRGEYYHLLGEERGEMGLNYNFGLGKVDLLPYSYGSHTTEWNCCFKMIASTMFFGGLSMLSEYEVKTLLGIVDVEAEAIAYAETEDKNIIPSLSDKGVGKLHGFIDGYERALKDKSDKKFTLEDMRKAIDFGAEKGLSDDIRNSFDWSNKSNNFINSLTQEKTEWEVDIETEVVPDFESKDRDNDGQIFTNMKKIQPLVVNGYVKILKIK